MSDHEDDCVWFWLYMLDGVPGLVLAVVVFFLVVAWAFGKVAPG